MEKNTESLSKLDPSETLGTDALLQLMELIKLRPKQKQGEVESEKREMEKPIADFRHRKTDQINPDSSELKKELREKGKLESYGRITDEKGEEKDSWGHALQKELDEKVRKFRELNRKK
ncbi:hypothetical protein niasHS_003962 [Heterodera schachtii]|uniref:Uncharacterized protein n=1 Tax=Heterodera schachtii TaxID=97005 RepID=A0ABD2K3Q7_HETSC